MHLTDFSSVHAYRLKFSDSDLVLLDGDWFLCRASYAAQRKLWKYTLTPDAITRLQSRGYIVYMSCFEEESKDCEPYAYAANAPNAALQFSKLMGIAGILDSDVVKTSVFKTESKFSSESVLDLTLKAYRNQQGWCAPGTKILMCFSDKKNWRYDLNPDNFYKSTRSTSYPPIHFDYLRTEFIKDPDIPTALIPDHEADDIIASLAQSMQFAAASPGPVIILSKDKDFLLLPNVIVTDSIPTFPITGTTDDDYMIARKACVKILVGDPGDNIVGCKGVGSVKAEKLLSTATTVRDLVERTGQAYVDDTCKQALKLVQQRRKELSVGQTLDSTITPEELVGISLYRMLTNFALISMGIKISRIFNPLTCMIDDIDSARTAQPQFILGGKNYLRDVDINTLSFDMSGPLRVTLLNGTAKGINEDD